jgi:hypothetical protein
MSIFEELENEGPVGARLFADRYEVSREFVERLHAERTRLQVSCYVGAGGNGKSALLRHLRDRCCVWLPRPQWEEVRALPPESFVDGLARARHATRVP